MYASKNFKTKKQFKDAVEGGRKISIYQPNNIFNTPDPTEGEFSVEGPWSPEPHKWYARVKVTGGFVVSVK